MDLKNNPNKESMFLQKQSHQKKIIDDYFIKMSKESEKSAKKLPQTSQNWSFLKFMTVGNTQPKISLDAETDVPTAKLNLDES